MVTGSVLTGVIGFFVVVACAETLYPAGITVDTAADAARALQPLVGGLAGGLFAVGLIGAALLAASVLPLSTAYSVCEYAGSESALDCSFAEGRLFYLTNVAVTAVAAGLVLIPGAPLVTILVLTQVLNAILLLPLLVFMFMISRDRTLMGDYTVSRSGAAVELLVIVAVTLCVGALLVLG